MADLGIETHHDGLPENGKKSGMFSGEPDPCRLDVGQILDNDISVDSFEGDRVGLLGVEHSCGPASRVDIVVENPTGRFVAVGDRINRLSLLGGVGAKQIMEGKAPWFTFFDQVRRRQLSQGAAGQR